MTDGKGTARVELWRFPTSHYSDHLEFLLRVKGVPYAVVKRPPTAYREARAHTGDDEWPFLRVDGEGVHWRRALDWVERHGPGPSLWPEDEAEADRARRVVHYLTTYVGHATRRVFFRAAAEDPSVAYGAYRARGAVKRARLRLYFPVVARLYGASRWATDHDAHHLDGLFAGEGLLRPPEPGKPLGLRRGAVDVAAATMLAPLRLVPSAKARWGERPLWRWAEREYDELKALPPPA